MNKLEKGIPHQNAKHQAMNEPSPKRHNSYRVQCHEIDKETSPNTPKLPHKDLNSIRIASEALLRRRRWRPRHGSRPGLETRMTRRRWAGKSLRWWAKSRLERARRRRREVMHRRGWTTHHGRPATGVRKPVRGSLVITPTVVVYPCVASAAPLSPRIAVAAFPGSTRVPAAAGG